jgi:hypothetical protein
MPKQTTIRKARQLKREGKSPKTQAGEFVREEIHHIREGVHGAQSAKQAIAIGLSKARRAGIDLPPPPAGQASRKTRRQAASDVSRGKANGAASPKRSRATLAALKRAPRDAASHTALSRHASESARKRTPAERRASARKAARTRKA